MTTLEEEAEVAEPLAPALALDQVRTYQGSQGETLVTTVLTHTHACGILLRAAGVGCTLWQPCDVVDMHGRVRAWDGAYALLQCPAISVI